MKHCDPVVRNLAKALRERAANGQGLDSDLLPGVARTIETGADAIDALVDRVNELEIHNAALEVRLEAATSVLVH